MYREEKRTSMNGEKQDSDLFKKGESGQEQRS